MPGADSARYAFSPTTHGIVAVETAIRTLDHFVVRWTGFDGATRVLGDCDDRTHLQTVHSDGIHAFVATGDGIRRFTL